MIEVFGVESWMRGTVTLFIGFSFPILVACAHEPVGMTQGEPNQVVVEPRALPSTVAQTAVAVDAEPGLALEQQPAQNPPPAHVDPNRFADVDPENDMEVAPPPPLPDCEERLQQAGIEYQMSDFPLKQQRGGVFTCGAEQAVTFKKGPEGIRYNGRPRLTCAMALALARFETVAQEMAQQHLGVKITRMTHIGTYSCRKMTRFTSMVSEHSYANAIDISTFWLSDGRKVSVLQHFGELDRDPADERSAFLRALARRLYDEDVFSVVLTPYFDRLHRDHFHLDLARYRVDGTRP